LWLRLRKFGEIGSTSYKNRHEDISNVIFELAMFSICFTHHIAHGLANHPWLTSVLPSPLKEKWRMLWAVQWSELNSRCKPIASYDDAGSLVRGH
jgi:hypothetical protein